MKTNNQVSATKMMPGHVERRGVRCGKANCRCADGKRHTAHYHVWIDAGVRHRRYVRRADVRGVSRACQAHRKLQAELRAGRAQWRGLVARLREFGL